MDVLCIQLIPKWLKIGFMGKIHDIETVWIMGEYKLMFHNIMVIKPIVSEKIVIRNSNSILCINWYRTTLWAVYIVQWSSRSITSKAYQWQHMNLWMRWQKPLHPTNAMWCNYLSLHLISASGTTLLICYLQVSLRLSGKIQHIISWD